MSKSIIIVEDEFPIALDMQKRLIKLDYRVCGISNNYLEAIDSIQQDQPDLVLLDINLNQDKSGFDIATWMNEHTTIPFMFVTAYADDFTFNSALKLGPVGFINKPFTDTEIFRQIELGFNRHSNNSKAEHMSKEDLIDKLDRHKPEGWTSLTNREKEVLVSLLDGKSDKQLAEQLFVSTTTIRTHLRRSYDKLLIGSRLEAVAYLNKFL